MSNDIARTVFGLLFESSTDAAFIVERRHGRLISANLRTADMLGRDLDQLIGMSLTDLSFEPGRDLGAPGLYEDVAFRRSDDFPVYAAVQVAHVDTDAHGPVWAYMARDTSERRMLEHELQAKHSALFTAHVELERAHAQLETAKRELENRNHEIALLAWRAAMGELVAGIAHHLNNPVGALASTVRRIESLAPRMPDDVRAEHGRLLVRIIQVTRRIESNVATIIKASRSNALDDVQGRPELPPELAQVLASFAERLDDIPTREPAA